MNNFQTMTLTISTELDKVMGANILVDATVSLRYNFDRGFANLLTMIPFMF